MARSLDPQHHRWIRAENGRIAVEATQNGQAYAQEQLEDALQYWHCHPLCVVMHTEPHRRCTGYDREKMNHWAKAIWHEFEHEPVECTESVKERHDRMEETIDKKLFPYRSAAIDIEEHFHKEMQECTTLDECADMVLQAYYHSYTHMIPKCTKDYISIYALYRNALRHGQVTDDTTMIEYERYILRGGRWKDRTVPHEGWKYIECVDKIPHWDDEDENVTYEWLRSYEITCWMCGAPGVRYAHKTRHKDVPRVVEVGTHCAMEMVGNKQLVKRNAQRVVSTAKKLNTVRKVDNNG